MENWNTGCYQLKNKMLYMCMHSYATYQYIKVMRDYIHFNKRQYNYCIVVGFFS